MDDLSFSVGNMGERKAKPEKVLEKFYCIVSMWKH